jgi:hypothetical protein
MEDQLNLFPLEFEEKVERAREIYECKQDEMRIALAYLNEILLQCPCKETVPKQSYNSGSYNDTAYTDYWDECVICKKQLNPRTKNHSWYG